MSIFKTIRAYFDRTPLIGGGGPQPELSGVRYFPSTQLPEDIDHLIKAELVAPWRVDSDGVQWYRADDRAIAAVDDFDPDEDLDLTDDNGFDEDDFDEDYTDDFDDYLDDEDEDYD